MKNTQYEQMYQTYQEGYSLSEVGKMYGMTRQSVFSGFKCRGYEMRTKKKLPFMVFDGQKFTLRNNGYYGKTYGDRELMHRYIWKFHNGEIPKNMDIHHINHDKSDNRIKNLEIYPKDEHAKKFSTGSNQYAKKTQTKNND